MGNNPLDQGINLLKWTLGLAAGAGLLVVVAKDGSQLGDFMKATAGAVVSFGQGIGQIAQ